MRYARNVIKSGSPNGGNPMSSGQVGVSNVNAVWIQYFDCIWRVWFNFSQVAEECVDLTDVDILWVYAGVMLYSVSSFCTTLYAREANWPYSTRRGFVRWKEQKRKRSQELGYHGVLGALFGVSMRWVNTTPRSGAKDSIALLWFRLFILVFCKVDTQVQQHQQ